MDVVLPGRPDGGAVAVEKARVKPSIWIASGDSTTRDLLENQLRQRYACDYESMPLPIGCSPFAITDESQVPWTIATSFATMLKGVRVTPD